MTWAVACGPLEAPQSVGRKAAGIHQRHKISYAMKRLYRTISTHEQTSYATNRLSRGQGVASDTHDWAVLAPRFLLCICGGGRPCYVEAAVPVANHELDGLHSDCVCLRVLRYDLQGSETT